MKKMQKRHIAYSTGSEAAFQKVTPKIILEGVARPEERKKAFLCRGTTCKGPERRENMEQLED